MEAAVQAQLGCWVDVYERSRFRGLRRRLFGPAVYHAVWCHASMGDKGKWGIDFQSLILGPGAWLRLYCSTKPAQTFRWLGPNHQLRELVEVKITAEIDSFQIESQPPAQSEVAVE
ncbi:MAG TPA: hypothetical protein VH518_02125 [Tepidisphaeraceae bacterium]|jgi:hypothetical protein